MAIAAFVVVGCQQEPPDVVVTPSTTHIVHDQVPVNHTTIIHEPSAPTVIHDSTPPPTINVNPPPAPPDSSSSTTTTTTKTTDSTGD